MKKYELLEHKADLKIRIYGQDLTKLFVNAGLAIAEQQNPAAVEPNKEWETITIKSLDLNSLLVDWLNEILSRSDLNHKVYNNFQIEELSENHLRAQIAGQKVVQKQIDIKAATYHNLEIKKVDDHWQVVIILDI